MAAKKTNWSSCNLLEPAAEGSRLWQFSVSSKKVKISGDLRVAEGDDPPAKAVGKDWSDLLSRKLNIATLPPEKVFLRVVEMPACEPDELLPMVEFQIEDLSPLPAVQTVWSAEPVPGSSAQEGNQTVLVTIAERSLVEERLEELEASNYLADRVEVPLLRELVTGEPREDGAHIQLVQGADSVLALVAWWFDGRLRDINSFNLPDHEASRDVLVEKINNLAWAGEVAGWMPGDPTCHLAKRGDVAADWKTALANCFGERISEVEPASEVDLVTTAVEFAARTTAPGLMIEGGIPGYRARIRPIVSRITIHWPSFYNVVTGKTLALPNLIALQHIPLSPAGVIAKRPAPIALPNSCAAEWRMAPDAVFSPYASVRYFTPHMVHSQYNLL